MGALFLYGNDSNIDISSTLSVFREKGFDEPQKFKVSDYSILFYKKIGVSKPDYLSIGDDAIFAVGTFIYRGLNSNNSLSSLFSDLRSEKFNPELLLGNYWILYKAGNTLSFLIDQSGIQNIFYSKKKEVITSSFLACVNSFQTPVTINKHAVTEILTTGTLIGPETMITEIERFEVNSGVTFNGLERIYPIKSNIPEKCSKSYDECLDEQINVLDQYFESVKELADEVGVDSGITGGHDSRLIMAMGLKHFKDISFNTHWRAEKNIEFDTAKELCEKADVDLNLIPVKNPADMTGEELEVNLNNSYLFFDGLVRMHSYWIEEYNTMQYRAKVLNNKRLGLSGIGGEQYRNEERMNKPVWNLSNVVKYKILLNVCGDCFVDGKSLKDTVVNIERKIRSKLGLKNKKSISRLEFKRYLNEVFIPGRLGARNNAENQFSYFLSPFTDISVSNQAYKIVYKLGPSLQFEEDMIKKINPEIASVGSDHGFDFYRGEPFSNKVKSFIIDFIPLNLLYSYYSKKTSEKDSSNYYLELIQKSEIVKKGLDRLKMLELPVDIQKLVRKPDLMPLVIAMAFLLEKLGNKISYE